jgi:hypothetical protein
MKPSPSSISRFSSSSTDLTSSSPHKSTAPSSSSPSPTACCLSLTDCPLSDVQIPPTAFLSVPFGRHSCAQVAETYSQQQICENVQQPTSDPERQRSRQSVPCCGSQALNLRVILFSGLFYAVIACVLQSKAPIQCHDNTCVTIRMYIYNM